MFFFVFFLEGAEGVRGGVMDFDKFVVSVVSWHFFFNYYLLLLSSFFNDSVSD